MYRIKKYHKGYVVEVRKTKWYGRKYWTHFISVAGIKSMPWYYSSYEYAEIGLLNEVRLQTIRNSKNQ